MAASEAPGERHEEEGVGKCTQTERSKRVSSIDVMSLVREDGGEFAWREERECALRQNNARP